MEITLTHVAIILVAGFICGVINTLAGGGSFLTLAALDLTGLPSVVANGTNRLAILIQNMLAVAGFRSKGVSDWRTSLHFAIPALFGAILGAYLIIDVPEVIFHRILGVAMLVMLATLILNPQKRLEGHPVEMTPARRVLIYIVFFGIGIYGGAIQAGIGFLMIASFVLTAGMDLVSANMHKAFVGATYTLFALATFALRGQVNWPLGIVLAIGNGSGAWFASRLAVEKGQRLVRIVLGITLVILSARYLGLFQYLGLNL